MASRVIILVCLLLTLTNFTHRSSAITDHFEGIHVSQVKIKDTIAQST